MGWQSLAERRKTYRVTVLYKAINRLVAIPMDELEHQQHVLSTVDRTYLSFTLSHVDANN